MKRKVIIMGAAGRDFHNFNVFFRENANYNVVAFTATQIEGIENRKYPKELSGRLYPNGIQIFPEKQLVELIKKHKVDEVVLAYSDLKSEEVMNKASIVIAADADFKLMGMETAIETKKPLITICAVRTGAGKGTIARMVLEILQKKGLKPVVIRHPMPYGDLKTQTCQRFASLKDLDKYKPTIEEREEYEPYIERGFVVYAGVDYENIIRSAEKECNIIVFEGGNNDLPFYRSDKQLKIVVADPLRPEGAFSYPGESNVIMADILVLNKINVASKENIIICEKNLRTLNKNAPIARISSDLVVDKPELIKKKKVLVVEDSPTVTHGNLSYAAGMVAAKKYGSSEQIDPKKHAVGSIKKVFERFPNLGKVLPSAGYTDEQLRDLEKTINNIKCDAVILGTPANIARFMKIKQPIVRVLYKPKESGEPILEKTINNFLTKLR